MKTGILLVNLGTPDSPAPGDVYRYLIEFLTDQRVIDSPWILRQLIVRGAIVPFRYKQSAKAYQEIWTEEGSPLLVYGKKVKVLLQKAMGSDYAVELAMRYRNPSIHDALQHLMKQDLKRLIILPLFPHYASATTGSVHQKIMEELSKALVIPETTFINSYATHPALIEAFCQTAQDYTLDDYDHILFSFHGLPEKHLKKSDRNDWCLQSEKCCQDLCQKNTSCYSAQCYSTAKEIARSLEIHPKKMSISFQSRLGKDPWLKPYTSNVIEELAAKGCKKLLVFSPAFVCDCLETIYEIGVEYALEFKKHGGCQLDLVPGLNDHPKWIHALKTIILDYPKNGNCR